MKKYISILAMILVITSCLMLSACQSKNAQLVDEQILALESKEVTLDLWEDISDIEGKIKALSEKEYNSLKNIGSYKQIVGEYELLESEAVSEIEEKISAIPAIDSIRLSSESTINAATSAFNDTTDKVREKVSNTSTLKEAQTRIETIKKESWVKCEFCGGDGKIDCSRCGGSGHRNVPYTTPNGKTWSVSQDCATTQTCGRCSGRGGAYVEKTETPEQTDTEE